MRLTRPGADAAATGGTPNVARNNADARARAGLTSIGANATVSQPVPPSPQLLSGDPRMQRFTRSVLLLLFAGIPAALHAQGFAVNELGICAMGRGGVSAASPCADGSAIWFNPAGLVGLSGTHIMVGGTLIRPFGGFTEDISATKTDLPSQSYLVPSAYVTHRLSPKVSVCIGRFAGYHTSIKSIYVQPTIAYQVTPRLALGLGVAYIHSNIELHQRVDLSQQTVTGFPFTFAALGIPTYTDFADATLKATGTGIALNGCITFKVND